MTFLDFALQDITGSLGYIARLLLAGFCGALIGLERTKKQKEAGIRTHVIVAIGAALVMIVSKYGFFDVVVYDSIQLDASRIASQVITGISFLGAGVIFFKNDTVKGLTTAAGIWATAGVGLATGAGMYTVSLVATMMIIVVHFSLHRSNIAESFVMDSLLVTVYNEPGVLDKLKEELGKLDLNVKKCHVVKHKNSTITIRFLLKHSTEVEWSFVLDFVEKNEFVKSVGM